MGETTCESCGAMLWHIRAHATGKCEHCGGKVRYCDSCMDSIPKGGDEHFQALLTMLGR